MEAMTIKDSMKPMKGVTVLESVGDIVKPVQSARGSSTLVDKANYQVWKRGKPFTKLAADKASPRMTRDSYFKLAESQGLSTMRDEMISIMGGPSQTDNLLTTR